jgi:surface antigen
MLNVARAQLGYTETPINRTRFGAWYGLDGNAWCAIFLSWCADQAGALDIIPRHAYTPTGANWFRARGAFDHSPRRGDLAFFQWPGESRISHVGIVEEVRSDGRITTIEGNAQPGEGGNQSDGGAVRRRIRALSMVAGFGHPDYAPEGPVNAITAVPVVMVTKTEGTSYRVPLVVDGVWGRKTTVRLQEVLGVTADGVIGPQTRRILQQHLGVTADGSWGPKTRTALQQRLGVRVDGVWGPATVRALQRRLNGGAL